LLQLQIGFGQISMSVGNVLWNIVEAQGRVRLATVVEIVTSWCFVVPLCAVSLYVFNFNLVGTVAAMVIGYSVGALWISYIVLTSDWALQSQVVIGRNGSHDLPFNDHTWDRLPKRAAKAAELLGSSKISWDAHRSVPLKESRKWNELSVDQRDAARYLGYNKIMWESNGSDSSNNKTCLKYDDYWWNDLPPDVQAAATVLGYTKKMWDEDGTPYTEDKEWQQLKPDQQEAARALGYNAQTWNDENRISSSPSEGSPPRTGISAIEIVAATNASPIPSLRQESNDDDSHSSIGSSNGDSDGPVSI
jgi:hypothetical protein